jgi:dolichol-phosphate mannosyltransferase
MACWREPLVISVLQKFNRPYVNELVLVIDEPEALLLDRVTQIGSAVPLKLIVNKRRMGTGFVIRQALKYCQMKGYKYVIMMAANGKDNPSEIPRFTRALAQGFDYVQGSRFMHKGRAERTPFLRLAFNKLWPAVWSVFIGKRITEVTNGFRAYAMRIVLDKRIHIEQHWLDHYALEYYIHYKALTCGYRYCEVPVTKSYPWSHKGGYSKIKPFSDWKHILLPPILLRLGLRD